MSQTTQHDEINPIRVLAAHAKKIAEDHGLVLRHFAVVPGLGDELDKAHIVMEFDPEAKKEPEAVLQQADEALTQAMLEAQREALEERAAQARADIEQTLRDRLAGGGGFLDPS